MASLEVLRADVRSHVDESLQAFWTETELDRWINEALRDISRRTETLQAVKLIRAETGVTQYDAPANMLRIYRVEYRQSASNIVPLEFRPLHDMDDVWYRSRSGGGSPQWWSFWGFPSDQDRAQLYVYPSPSETVEEGIAVFYYRLPNVLVSDTQIADISAGWEDLVPLYVEVLCLRKDKDRRWKDAYDLYEARIGDMIAMTRQPTDQMQYFSGGGGGGIPGWLSGNDGGW